MVGPWFEQKSQNYKEVLIWNKAYFCGDYSENREMKRERRKENKTQVTGICAPRM